MGIILIVIGFFLCFTLAFNGGIGTPFVNYSLLISAMLMVTGGILRLIYIKWLVVRSIAIVSLICYLPVIWQRFNFGSNVDWIGLYFDIAIIVFVLFFVFIEPEKKIIQKTDEDR